MRYEVSSGEISSGIILNLDSMYIDSGGTANNTTINSGGEMWIDSGGTANSTTINSGGDMAIYSGGTANSTTINSGGDMDIYYGGTANSTTINSGGHMIIYTGGTATNIIENGGFVYVAAGVYATFASNTIEGVVLSYMSMTVHKNTIANNTTINSSGRMYISSGGTANNTTINSGGDMDIYSGGTATNIIENGGYVYVANGAYATFASNTIKGFVLSYGSMTVHKNTIANSTTINYWGDMDIYSGGVANSTTINSDGHMIIYSGGTATNIIENGGYVYVADGAYATFASNTIEGFVLSYGSMTVHKNTIANSTTISGGRMYISSGGVANSTTISGGRMYISSGGTANSTTINDWGDMRIDSDGVANSTAINSGGRMYISADGIHRGSLQIKSGAIVSAYSGGIIDFTVAVRKESDGYLINNLSLIEGAPTYTITVSASQSTGTYKLAQGASSFNGSITICNPSTCFGTLTVNGTALQYNGRNYSLVENNGNLQLIISSGSSSGPDTPPSSSGGSQVKVYSSGNLVKQGTVLNGEMIVSGRNNSMTITNGGTANSTTINDWGYMRISSGGTANSTTINSGGDMTIYSGGTANGTTINDDWGSMTIYSGGVANSTTIHSGGNMYISYGGTANSTTINSGGTMYIFYGGTATEIIENGGYVDVQNGAYATFASNTIEGFVLSDDIMTVHENTIANSTTINDWGDMDISSGGVANSTTINSGGYMDIYSGGTANSTTINDWGFMRISSGGTANSTTINSGGNMNISSGGTANSTTINDWGFMRISSGGTANCTTINSGGWMYIFSGGTANCTTINDWGTMYISSGGVANSTTINSGGDMYIEDGGTANDTTIHSGGYMCIKDGGTANSTTINSGLMWIYSGGVANSTTINSRIMCIASGGIHRGSLQIKSGAVVSAYSGSIIVFTVADRKESDEYLINNLALIQGAPTYTITVSADQEAGIYKLAQGAAKLTESITICTRDTCFGSLTVNGEALTFDGVTYDLNNINGDLTLTITVLKPEYIVGNFNGMFEFTSDGSGTLYTPAGKQEIAGTLDPAKWEVVGAGDFNKSGTDGLLWIEKDTGYVYVQNDLTNFDEIKNKANCLGVLGEGYHILGTGDFTGTGISGVLMQGPAFGDESISLNYGLPIWGREADGTTFAGWLGALVNTWQPGDALKGDTSDLADINAKNYMYEVVSVGDYNGDGVDDVMLQNIMPENVDGVTITGSGDVFTFLTGDINAIKAGASPTVAYAGCATDGWEIKGSGDFDGDGIDDVLLSDGTGVAGWKMTNGQRVENQWFGNLGANEEISGITDLNNDGTDDILILNTATDTYSGWLVKDGVITGSITLA